MIATESELSDATAFERYALATGFPLLPTPTSVAQASLDMRNPTREITIGVVSVEDLGAHARQDVIDQLRPLLFGAAWKVLDLVLEFAYFAEGHCPQTPGRWQIAEKQRLARRNCGGRQPPWMTHPDLWERICALYDATAEARHCLVHRRVSFSPAGDMIDIRDQTGARKPDVTAADQLYFAKTAQRVVASTLSGVLRNRERSPLAWLLDQLGAHHGKSVLGGHDAHPVEVVRTNATRTASGWVVNVEHAATEIRRVFANRPFYDIEIHFPESGLPPLAAALEDVPSGTEVSVDPRHPPVWARF